MKISNLSLIVFLLLCTQVTIGQTWDGSVSSIWTDQNNWTPATVPTNTSNVIINSAPNNPALPSDITVNSFSMNSGSVLNFNGFTLLTNGALDINGATLNNSNGATDISITINGTGSQYIRNSTVNDNIIFEQTGTGAFYEAFQGGNIFNDNATFNHNSAAAAFTSYSNPSTFLGNVIINRTVAGTTNIFDNGFIALSGNFSYSNIVGGATTINTSNLPTALIGGTVNISTAGGTNPTFTMRRIKNNTTGGTVSVQNSGTVNITNDTLSLTAFNVNGFTGAGTDDFDANEITGTVNISDDTENIGSYYFRRSVVNGNTTIAANGAANLFEAFQGGNIFNGNTNFNFGGSGGHHTSYSAPSSFLGNLTINRTVAGSTEIFENGFIALSGNFSYTNTAGGVTTINTSNLPTGLIGGTVNINVTGAANPVFTMRRIKNNTTGGTVSVQNSGTVNITNDTLSLTAFNVNGFTGAGTDDFDANEITGTVNISDDADNIGSYYFRRSVVNGNTTIAANGAANLFEAFQGGNIFNGNTNFNFGGSGGHHTSYSAPSSFLGNLTINRTVAGSTEIFENGFIALSGNFSYTNTAGGVTAINTLNLPTGQIGGTVNITANGIGNPAFTMRRIKNTTTGGTVSVQNSSTVNITNDTLSLIAFNVNGFTGAGTDDFDANVINGTVNISDGPLNTGSVYHRGSIINGDFTYTQNSAASLFEAFQRTNLYNGNVTLNRVGTANINFAYSEPVSITGNFTWNSAAGIVMVDTVKFIGNTNSTIEQLSTDNLIIARMVVDKTGAANVILNDPLILSSKIRFVNGDVVTTATNMIRFIDGAVHSDASNNSHVNGPVTKIGNDAFTFPTGNGTILGQVAMSAPSATTEFYSAQYFNDNPDLAGFDTSLRAGTIDRVSGYEYWEIQRTSGVSNVNLTFSFSDPGSGQYITVPADARIGRWNGSQWNDIGNNASTGTTSGTITANTANDGSTLRQYTFASTDLVTNPLLDVVIYTYYADADNDTFGDLNNTTTSPSTTPPTGFVANSTDCNDNDNTVFPGAPELCDLKDNDCDGTTDEAVVPPTWYADTDGDGFGDPAATTTACFAPTGYISNNADCNDDDDTVFPGAPELCDTKDNDCDGSIDEGVQNTYYRDFDNDNFGDAATTVQACTPPTGYVSNDDDCNDADNTVYPNAPELCDGKDNDCDGSIDEGGVQNTYYADTDNDGFGNPLSSTQGCTPPTGFVADNTDCNDNNNTIYPNAPELCDNLDNDCDGTIDDGAGTTPYYADADNDNFGDPNTSVTGCTVPPGYVSNNTDCNDADNTVYPNAPELCDTKDNDCDGSIDEGATNTYYQDNDGDNFGNPSVTATGCTAPTGYVLDNTDCNDADNTVYPNAPELCDNKDNDCDGSIDEGATNTYYQDSDGDNFGNPAVTASGCTAPTGYVLDNTDCNDADNTVYPNAPELCDSKDNDCDGTIDEGVTNTYYQDSDADNFGNPAVTATGCTAPTGYVTDNTDCDDTDNTVFPGATEIADGQDNDCDGLIDEGSLSTFYLDSDNDNFGDINYSVTAATAPPGYVINSTDCNDNNNTIYPGAPELCDGLDNNCDGTTDGPTLAPIVTGPVNMCPFEGTGQQVVFTIAPVTGVTTYNWQVPSTVSIVTGQGTGTLTVTISNGFGVSANKQIRVTATSVCGVSPLTIYYLLAQFPSTPGPINGPLSVCTFAGTTNEATYFINKVTAATSYNWIVPAGATLTGHPQGLGINDTVITVTYSSGFVSGDIVVTALNNCGSSTNTRRLTVSNVSPSNPGLIQGSTNGCIYMPSAAYPTGIPATYFIRKVTGATSYNWNATSGISITSHPQGTGVNDTIIIVTYSAAFTGGSITVSATGNCGTGGTRSLAISANLKPAAAGTITATETQTCPDRQVTYSLSALPASANWVQWTVPVNGTIISGQGTSSIVVSYGIFNATGQITATPSNGCGTGRARTLSVNFGPCTPPGPFVKNAASSPQGIYEVSVFPNPSATSFLLQVKSNATDIVQVSVYDVTGKLHLQFNTGTTKQVRFGSDLKPGLYFIETRQKGKVSRTRVIKI